MPKSPEQAIMQQTIFLINKDFSYFDGIEGRQDILQSNTNLEHLIFCSFEFKQMSSHQLNQLKIALLNHPSLSSIRFTGGEFGELSSEILTSIPEIFKSLSKLKRVYFNSTGLNQIDNTIFEDIVTSLFTHSNSIQITIKKEDFSEDKKSILKRHLLLEYPNKELETDAFTQAELEQMHQDHDVQSDELDSSLYQHTNQVVTDTPAVSTLFANVTSNQSDTVQTVKAVLKDMSEKKYEQLKPGTDYPPYLLIHLGNRVSRHLHPTAQASCTDEQYHNLGQKVIEKIQTQSFMLSIKIIFQSIETAPISPTSLGIAHLALPSLLDVMHDVAVDIIAEYTVLNKNLLPPIAETEDLLERSKLVRHRFNTAEKYYTKATVAAAEAVDPSPSMKSHGHL